jgi:uncharacterized protein with von Willebrand factor type A (vWA) domain
MNSFRYSKCELNQAFDIDPDKVIDEFKNRLITNGDVTDVLWQMQKKGFSDQQGRHLPSLEELLQKVQQEKLKQMSRYDLNSVVDDIRKMLDDIVKTEREGIQNKIDEINQRPVTQPAEISPEMQQKLLKSMADQAFRNRQKLDDLPLDIGGRVKSLSQYDFIDESAKRKFQDLMNLLKKRALDTYARELGRTLQNLDPDSIEQIKSMLRALNTMLEEKKRGQKPDFDDFKRRFGHLFGPNPPESLDDLTRRLQDQISQAQSLLNSLSQEQRQELQSILKSVLDPETQFEFAKLDANLDYLERKMESQEQYPFFGDEPISYSQALKLMETLQKMDKLENQINESRYNHSLDSIDDRMVKEILGDETASELEAIRSITQVLENSGYLRHDGRTYELTPFGIRKIGEKALNSVFSRLKKDRQGEHRTPRPGGGGEQLYETKKYEFGDDFDLNIEKTIMNALLRQPQIPVKLDVKDFEIFKEEQLSRSATVLMLDLSLSMHMHGNFQSAKIVAIALDTLIRSKFPRDSLYIVGFSSYARSMTSQDLNHIDWDNLDPYTNMQHGFSLARKLLNRDASANKQILLVSDGEPTAHFENAHIFFQYPPSPHTIQLTLNEVKNCTRSGIIINAFMLRNSGLPCIFMNQVTHINRGRVFYTDSDSLGHYVIVDYLTHKKQKVL